MCLLSGVIIDNDRPMCCTISLHVQSSILLVNSLALIFYITFTLSHNKCICATVTLMYRFFTFELLLTVDG